MMQTPSIFVDAETIIASLWPEPHITRQVLRLGELGAVRLSVDGAVLYQLEEMLRATAPKTLGMLALLLDRCNVEIVPTPNAHLLRGCRKLVSSEMHAEAIAAAWECGSHYFVTLNPTLLVNNIALHGAAPFRIGAPEDCRNWLREHFRALSGINTSSVGIF